MADGTKIEWCDATWNPIVGCTIISPGCTNCYAMRQAPRTDALSVGAPWAGRAGKLTQPSKAGPVWTGSVRFVEHRLEEPLHWRKPRRIFVNSMGDLFHESVPDEWIDRVFAVMALCPHHTFLVLTKRAARMREYLTGLLDESNDDPRQPHQRILTAAENLLVAAPAVYGGNPGERCRDLCEMDEPCLPLPNVWLGFSAEDQPRLNERWRDAGALAEQGWLVWCSAEPLLGPLDFTRVETIPDGLTRRGIRVDALTGRHYESGVTAPGYKLSWIVAGGESGPNARPMHPDWARSLRDQCAAAGVPFFFKQHGEWIGVPDLRRLPNGSGPGFDAYDHCQYDMDHEAVRVGKSRAGRLLDGREHNEFPA